MKNSKNLLKILVKMKQKLN